MTARKAPPPFVENVLVRLRTDRVRHQLVIRRSSTGLAAVDEIRPRPSHGILDQIGDKGAHGQRDHQTEHGDMEFMRIGTEEDPPQDEDDQRNDSSIDDRPHSMDVSDVPVCLLFIVESRREESAYTQTPSPPGQMGTGGRDCPGRTCDGMGERTVESVTRCPVST